MNEKSLPATKYFIQRAYELGANETKVIIPQHIFTAEWVRWKCHYGCDGFGECLTCPPYSPTPKETRQMLDEYKTAILIHFTSKEWIDIKNIVYILEREAFISGYYKAFGLGAGPCNLCEKCDVKKVCKNAEKARPSMEACGIDVFRTARTVGFPIEVVKNHTCPQNYYGLLLLV